jgi:hypothetical protein
LRRCSCWAGGLWAGCGKQNTRKVAMTRVEEQVNSKDGWQAAQAQRLSVECVQTLANVFDDVSRRE